MSRTVVGLFDTTEEAQKAAQDLYSAGFNESDVDISANMDAERTRGFFSSLFDSDEANNYNEVANRGASIVTVHTDSSEEAERAGAILDGYGAVDVDERAMQYRGSTSDTYTDTSTRDTYTDTERTDRNAIPIVEEQINVGKQVVETGGARVRSRIIEKPVEAEVRLRQEHIVAERHPVDRPATEGDLSSFREGEIELTERGEVPVVNKEARVVEEVSLGKQVEERTETVSDTVRRTDIDVEQTDAHVDTTARRDANNS